LLYIYLKSCIPNIALALFSKQNYWKRVLGTIEDALSEEKGPLYLSLCCRPMHAYQHMPSHPWKK